MFHTTLSETMSPMGDKIGSEGTDCRPRWAGAKHDIVSERQSRPAGCTSRPAGRDDGGMASPDPGVGTPPNPTQVEHDDIDGLRFEVVELRIRAEIAEARAEERLVRAEIAERALASGQREIEHPIFSPKSDASLRLRRAENAERALRAFGSGTGWWRR